MSKFQERFRYQSQLNINNKTNSRLRFDNKFQQSHHYLSQDSRLRGVIDSNPRYSPRREYNRGGKHTIQGWAKSGERRNRGNPDAKALRLTAVVGGRAAVSLAYDRAAALKRRRASEGNAAYRAHGAETVVTGGLPLDVPYHLALLVHPRPHTAPYGMESSVSSKDSTLSSLQQLDIQFWRFNSLQDDI